MAFVQYVAAESVMVGHAASVTYTFDFQIERADLNTRILRARPESLSGAVETLFFGNTRRWIVTMAPIQAQERFLYEEFLDSVANGQVFTFDPYGTSAHHVRVLQVVRDDETYAPERVSITGDPEYQDYLRYSFSVLEQ